MRVILALPKGIGTKTNAMEILARIAGADHDSGRCSPAAGADKVRER
jgi:hypothetical protein